MITELIGKKGATLHDNTSENIAVTNNEYSSSVSARNKQHRQKYTERKKIEIAIEKYRAGGHGLNFIDVMEDFHIRKRQAQSTLKNLYHKGVFFTAIDLLRQGIYLTENKKPQEYFPNF